MALGELKNGIGPDAYAIYQQVLAAVVERDHPVGSLYISENSTSPAELYGGTWERVEDCTIWGASDTHPAGTTVEAGLPNITGAAIFRPYDSQYNTSVIWKSTGAFSYKADNTENSESIAASVFGTNNLTFYFDASRSNPIYGASTTVQPPAYCMYIWRRVA